MVQAASPSREFRPGTTGWTASDLNDPETERLWERGSYEIVEGVLVTMPPAYFDSSAALMSLMEMVQGYLRANGIKGRFGPEADLIANEDNVTKPHMVLMLEADLERQKQASTEALKPGVRFGRLRVPPMLVIESVSPGHERHDRRTKRLLYARAKVPNYWILDAYQQTLECLILADDEYRTDATGGGEHILHPSMFPGLALPLKGLWD